MGKIFITVEKFRSLRQKVKDLKTKHRKAIADKLSEYRDSVDLMEDSSYTDLLQTQADLEEEIQDLEGVLLQAKIIKEKKSKTIRLGSSVVIQKSGNGRKIPIKLVGSFDADPLDHTVSNESPLGMALLGKKKGDTVEITTPTGKNTYKILDVA